MQVYSILVAVDQTYYDNWALTLLKSINFNCPDIKLRCHVVNPKQLKKLSFVDYTTEIIKFENEDSRLAYLQAARFLAVSKLPTTECILTLDADTICCKKFTKDDFIKLFNKQYISQKDKKPDRWLCGFISFGNNNFRYEYARLLNADPIPTWKFGRDQKVLSKMRDNYSFVPTDSKWLSFGRNGRGSIFLTLKGDQKTTHKYLEVYRQFKNEIKT
jgi:hypothetical protein